MRDWAGPSDASKIILDHGNLHAKIATEAAEEGLLNREQLNVNVVGGIGRPPKLSPFPSGSSSS